MNENYPQMALTKASMEIRPQSLRERLEYQKQRLESNLADVNGAIEALDSNPEILKALEAVQKVSHLG
jgi:hypothetical protein